MLQDVCKGGATRKRVVQEYADLLAACEVDNPLASQASLMNSVLAGKAHAAAADSTVTQVAKVRLPPQPAQCLAQSRQLTLLLCRLVGLMRAMCLLGLPCWQAVTGRLLVLAACKQLRARLSYQHYWPHQPGVSLSCTPAAPHTGAARCRSDATQTTTTSRSSPLLLRAARARPGLRCWLQPRPPTTGLWPWKQPRRTACSGVPPAQNPPRPL